MTQNTNKFAGAQEVFFKELENNFDYKMSKKKAAHLALKSVAEHFNLESYYLDENDHLHGTGDLFITGFDNCNELEAFASELGLALGEAKRINGHECYQWLGDDYNIKPIKYADRLLEDNSDLTDFDAELEWLNSMSKEERKSFYQDSPLHAKLRTLKRPRINKLKEIRVTDFKKVWNEPIEWMYYSYDSTTWQLGCRSYEWDLERLISAFESQQVEND